MMSIASMAAMPVTVASTVMAAEIPAEIHSGQAIDRRVVVGRRAVVNRRAMNWRAYHGWVGTHLRWRMDDNGGGRCGCGVDLHLGRGRRDLNVQM